MRRHFDSRVTNSGVTHCAESYFFEIGASLICKARQAVVTPPVQLCDTYPSGKWQHSDLSITTTAIRAGEQQVVSSEQEA